MASQSGANACGNYRLECRFTPRLARDILAELSEKQKDIVRQIGFGSVLRFPFYRRVHRKFYAWLLASLDTDRMVLQAGCGREIAVTAESVRRILALPMGNLPVTSTITNECNEAKLQVCKMMGIRSSSKMLFSLCNRIYLLRTRYCLDEKEIDQFICSFMSVVVCYFLSPRNKSDGFEPNIFVALKNPRNVSDFNWCQFVVDEIKRSSIIVKKALGQGSASVNLFGCVIFLQALYFDSLPLAQNFSIGLSEPIVADYTDDVISSIMKMQSTNVVFKKFSEFSVLMGKHDYRFTYPSNTNKRRVRRKLYNDRAVVNSIMKHLMDQVLAQRKSAVSATRAINKRSSLFHNKAHSFVKINGCAQLSCLTSRAMDSFAPASVRPIICVRIDPSAVSTLVFPFGCGIVRSFDTSRPLAIHNSRGCITLFEWKTYASGRGRCYLDVGWKEYCSDFRINVGDTCMFTNMGRHNVSLLVQDESGVENKPSSCMCTIGLGHKKVNLCSAQTAILMDKYYYVTRSVYLTPDERQRLALLTFVSGSNIPFYVFQHKARLYLNGWMIADKF
ncbi:hypothetical protein ACP70R_018172 [Stipagrostis hirtigluma subsp. patula]